MNERPVRLVTAVARYDGHDASIQALNTALLSSRIPVEIIYLGFHVSAEQICTAAAQEDAHGIAVASYNGGHMHFFTHLLDQLEKNNLSDIKVFGGGGATISPDEAIELQTAGVEAIYGSGLSLEEVSNDILERLVNSRTPSACSTLSPLPRMLTMVTESFGEDKAGYDPQGPVFDQVTADPPKGKTLLVTGDGGAGKSTIIDELVSRFLESFPRMNIGILANDPTTVHGLGQSALLADRLRMNSVYDPRVFMRSIATGSGYTAISPALPSMLELCRRAEFDLIVVETPGVGQTGIDPKPLKPDLSICVKTKEYGSSLQLVKEQMLQDVDLVVLNKIDIGGSETALYDLQNLLHQIGSRPDPPIGVLAKLHRDQGMDHLFENICIKLGYTKDKTTEPVDIFSHAKRGEIVPHGRRNYLAEIVRCVREYDDWANEQVSLLRKDPENFSQLDRTCREMLNDWPALYKRLSGEDDAYSQEARVTTVNDFQLPRIGLPDPEDRPEVLRFLLEEGLPGSFPFATGIHPYRLVSAHGTTRQFAGLRGPEETNRRLHYLSRGFPNPRLSIAFDGITLYGEDSDQDPGSRGKIGEGGVAVDSYEDMKQILKGFDIDKISTSMTINGPAPIILAMYFIAALETVEEQTEKERGRALTTSEKRELQQNTFAGLRGTVQADILKEVQAQNECIFQTDFAMRMLADVQQYFVDHDISSFYSLSISGYHIGEAGATPAQELAFTLANGFTYVEYFLNRNMAINDFASSLSFFFRVSHEAEWLAYGPVCRKIWAIAMRDRYGADSRSQRFKFHTQTSGRALQAAEWDTLNPIRQTYHAYLGLLNNTNSLHVDSADEPMTTPTEKYVRQAAMIPNYLQEEAEAFAIQNLLSGSYAFRATARKLQAAILEEFERLDQLGGVAAATELGYQRKSIAESSARYELARSYREEGEPARKIIGFNAYLQPENGVEMTPPEHEVIRPTEQDQHQRITAVHHFREKNREEAQLYLRRLEEVASGEGNIFAELLRTVRYATLGQITDTLARVGGRFRKLV